MSSFMEQDQPSSEYQGNLDVLMQISLFRGLPFEPRKLLAYLCTRETFKPGEYLFRQDEVDENAYFIMEGSATLTRRDGDVEETLRQFGQGDFIGGLSLLISMKRLFSLKAEDKVRCLILSKDKLQKTIEQFPAIAQRIVQENLESIYRWELRLVNETAAKCPLCRPHLGVTLI